MTGVQTCALPILNLALGWDRVPYLVLPGLHQPGSTFELTIAPAVWEGLSAADRAIIEESALAVTYDTWTSLGIADNAAMATFAERGVTIVDLDPVFIDDETDAFLVFLELLQLGEERRTGRNEVGLAHQFADPLCRHLFD